MLIVLYVVVVVLGWMIFRVNSDASDDVGTGPTTGPDSGEDSEPEADARAEPRPHDTGSED